MPTNLRVVIALLTLISFSFETPTIVGASPPDFVPGAGTLQENRDYQEIWNVVSTDSSESLASCDKFLGSHPENRLARLKRAEILMNQGQISAASRDLDVVAANTPDFPGLIDEKTDLARVSGRSSDELALMELVRAQTAKIQAYPSAAVSALVDDSRIAELKGDNATAEKKLREAMTSKRNQRWLLSVFADFLFRQDQELAATQLLIPAVETSNKEQNAADPATILDLVSGFWATNRPDDAMKLALDTLDSLPEVSREDRFYLPNLAVVAHLLAQRKAVGADDISRANRYFGQILEDASPARPYSLDRAILVLAGRADRTENINRLRSVLREAPNLPWADWSATYMVLAYPADSSDLASLIPPHSIFSKIVGRMIRGRS
jgi:tetratricopeptide (TPR) repeat protein